MKNMDPLNDNIATLLHQSSDKFVSELWKDGMQPDFLHIFLKECLSNIFKHFIYRGFPLP